jgi:hypothetical protein
MTPLSSGVDEALKLEAIYYSAPIPRNLAVLTVLGAVFDKVHFPGVYMPKDGFDQKELDKEIARIEGVTRPGSDSDILLSILRFIRHVPTLEGFCVFTGDGKNPFSDQTPERMVKEIYDAIHGPPPPNWVPHFSTNYVKEMPGSKEHVAYPGDFHYLAGAVLHSAKTGVPLLNDIPGLPIPGLEEATPTNNAKILSAILAIECVKIALPEIPLLRLEDLMEFRAENTTTLRGFRRSMLRYAADLNGKLRGLTSEEIQKATEFFVQTEIVPVLDELQSAMNHPARSWYNRGVDFFRVVPELVTTFMTIDRRTAIAKVLTTYAGQFFTELTAKGEQRDALKRSGLYYLLRLQTYQSDHRP